MESSGNFPGQFVTSDNIVYVPLLGRGGGVGVVEIHGLLLDGFTDNSKSERSESVISAMIAAQDFRFIEYTKFWRKPNKRSGGYIGAAPVKEGEISLPARKSERKDISDFDKNNYHVVCGRVVEVVREKNGIPYFGGARFGHFNLFYMQ
jgi:hypothetical protein